MNDRDLDRTLDALADAEVPDTGTDGDTRKREGTAAAIVKAALQVYRLGVSSDGLAFGVADGKHVVKVLRGGQGSLRGELARAYYAATGKVASASAVTDAILTLQGIAEQAAPEAVHLRVAQHDGSVVIDLGRGDGKVAIVRATGWHLSDVSPVLFRRSALTGELPEPIRGGSLDELRALLNVGDEHWPLLLGWLLAALLPDVCCPIGVLTGPQGSGKSTIARLIAGIVDPSAAPCRAEPRDVGDWACTASASRVCVLDNVSHLAPWLTDALCRAVTGDALLKRQLYSDSDLTVLHFRRAVVLTSIALDAMRSDFSDRLLLLELAAISEGDRKGEGEVTQAYEAARPAILGGLCDLLSRVLAELPGVKSVRLPRLAGFGKVLLALDRATGSAAFDTFMSQRGTLAEAVVESDCLAVRVREWLADTVTWGGTAAELLAVLTPEKPPRGWPRTPQHLSARLRHAAPALAEVGLRVTFDRAGRDRRRLITLALSEGENVVRVVRTVRTGPDAAENADPADGAADGADGDGLLGFGQRPHENGPDAVENAAPDAADAAAAELAFTSGPVLLTDDPTGQHGRALAALAGQDAGEGAL